MQRDAMLAAIRDRRDPWDIVIIGGGATGLYTAVDAASRGYAVALFEQADFAKGTSSRSTKLVHGGVRYLQQGNVSLVMEALKERGLLRHNAPHLVHDLAFVVPSYEWWESPFYGVGLKVYDMLAGRYGFGKSTHLSRDEVVQAIPSIQTDGLRGGTRYYDGQFDDARLAINLAATAAGQGAFLCNYARIIGLLKDGAGVIQGVRVRDDETGQELTAGARVVINATGAFSDGVRRMDHADTEAIIAPSQGVHLVLDRSFLPGDSAIMVPHTEDHRIMFAIPWHGVTVLGTTDTPIDTISLEPRPMPEEVRFILETANRYLARPATTADLRSSFAGIRPLVRAQHASSTAALSREHTVMIDPASGLLTIAGGKWTTSRRMAADTVDHAAELGGLAQAPCVTKDLEIHGHHTSPERFGPLAIYGSDAPEIDRICGSSSVMAEPVHPRLALTFGEVAWACRAEMARTVDDVLARRSRSLLLDARAARDAARPVAEAMATELGRDGGWVGAEAARFEAIASGYIHDD